mmetsp:Transcript_6753/g.19440  ORF Transcript_6753/g.19440 Transcript_6753/m.19440 type:complete len:219 (+) Transcript_6753:1020-1676(+)
MTTTASPRTSSRPRCGKHAARWNRPRRRPRRASRETPTGERARSGEQQPRSVCRFSRGRKRPRGRERARCQRSPRTKPRGRPPRPQPTPWRRRRRKKSTTPWRRPWRKSRRRRRRGKKSTAPSRSRTRPTPRKRGLRMMSIFSHGKRLCVGSTRWTMPINSTPCRPSACGTRKTPRFPGSSPRHLSRPSTPLSTAFSSISRISPKPRRRSGGTPTRSA